MGSETEAKWICVRKLEDLLVDPMFTIFHVQHEQIASKTETQNSLIYHFKCSMAKVRHWNSTTVRQFCSNLMTRFPTLEDSFLILFQELQELTCKILNQSSETTSYVPVREEVHTYLHSFISACSDAFISHPQWFSVDESSTEFQSCKNNAKARMQQANIIENTVMNFVKAGPKVLLLENTQNTQNTQNTPRANSDDDKSISSMKSISDHFSDSDDKISKNESDLDNESVDEFLSDSSRTMGSKSIDLISGTVKEVDESEDGPQFSTPFANKISEDSEDNEDSEDSKDSKHSTDGYDTWYTTSTDSDSDSNSSDSDLNSSDSDLNSSDSDSNSSDSDSSDSDSDSSDSDSDSSDSFSDSSSDSTSDSSSDSDFDTNFDGTSSSSGSDTETSDESASEGSDTTISIGDISTGDDSSHASNDSTIPVDLIDHILKLKRKEKRHRRHRKNRDH